MRGDWLKIWIARQPRSVPRSTALARPPARETCAPISMAADYEGSSPGAWQGQKWLARADVTPDEVRTQPEGGPARLAGGGGGAPPSPPPTPRARGGGGAGVWRGGGAPPPPPPRPPPVSLGAP